MSTIISSRDALWFNILSYNDKVMYFLAADEKVVSELDLIIA